MILFTFFSSCYISYNGSFCTHFFSGLISTVFCNNFRDFFRWTVKSVPLIWRINWSGTNPHNIHLLIPNPNRCLLTQRMKSHSSSNHWCLVMRNSEIDSSNGYVFSLKHFYSGSSLIAYPIHFKGESIIKIKISIICCTWLSILWASKCLIRLFCMACS